MRIFYWVGTTVTQDFNTGIQRVTRGLGSALQKKAEIIPVKWNASETDAEPITAEEAEHLAKWGGPHTKTRFNLPENKAGDWLLIPEISIAERGNPVAWGFERGLNVAAIFYDTIPFQNPDLYSTDALDNLSRYIMQIIDSDVVITISQAARDDLSIWALRKGKRSWPFATVSLPGEIANMPRATAPHVHPPMREPFKMIAIGTWEPRKNYERLANALKLAIKNTGRDIRLSIVGRDAGFPSIKESVQNVANDMPHGALALYDFLDDDALADMHASAHATVFSSYLEGFGLPIVESIWRGKPCICHNTGAIAEVAEGGGTMMINTLDENEIARAIATLATDSNLYNRLSQEAVARPMKSWDDYAEEIIGVLGQSARGRNFVHDPLGF